MDTSLEEKRVEEEGMKQQEGKVFVVVGFLSKTLRTLILMTSPSSQSLSSTNRATLHSSFRRLFPATCSTSAALITGQWLMLVTDVARPTRRRYMNRPGSIPRFIPPSTLSVNQLMLAHKFYASIVVETFQGSKTQTRES